ncbi:MAG TPA: cytochrome c [Saprospiraceae bacterium]|nr:cytochrome c [Saprospiraceae bacterium]HNT21033.1 cytochrome c [Saprospiraceae bacterium]
MKLQSKTILLLLAGSIYVMACQGKKSDSQDTAAAPAEPAAAAPASNAEGKKIFETYCVLCHGVDGKLGLNGSKDLSISVLPIEEKIIQVTNGKNLMTPFKDILTEDEIKAVVAYTEELKVK